MIAVATMCLHNFIHENHSEDKHFSKCDHNRNYVSTIPLRYRKRFASHNAGDTSTSESNDWNMDKLRDYLDGQYIFLDHHEHTCLYYRMTHIMTLHSHICFNGSFLCKKLINISC